LPIIVTVSSDGKMNVHDVTSIFKISSTDQEIEPMASYDTAGSRLVCCRVAEVKRTVKQIKQEADVKAEQVKKEEPGSGAQLRFKDDDGGDDEDGNGDDGAEVDGMDEDEVEQEEEDEEEEELEDEVEEE
jgi:hypothetical protein